MGSAYIGRYQVWRLLGEGATSAVHLAWDPVAGREVALKHIHREFLLDPLQAQATLQQIGNEAALADRLNHPHIVQILDAMVGEREAWIVMEYVAGGTLETCCQPQQLPPFERLTEIMLKCARALEYAFTQGVTHRDIKPANILLVQAGGNDVKLTDFGAAVFHDIRRTVVSGIGSPAYMSPEQLRDEAVSHQTDIYSLGVVMYQLLTGRLPYESDNHWSLAWKVSQGDAPRPSSLRPDIPPELDAIVVRAMHKSRAARYASWGEFAHDLMQAARTQRLTARRDPPPDAVRFEVLRRMSFFKHFDDARLWEVLRFAQWREASAGTLIMRKGEPGDFFALLATGQASVCAGRLSVHSLGMGECFGEMSLFAQDGGLRSADVIADSDCSFLSIRSDALSLTSPTCQALFQRAFLETMADRLAQANQRNADRD